MAEKAKPQEESSEEGAPLWIVSFADMISLLMAFFVMLTTFSSFGPRESERIRMAVKTSLLPNYGWHGDMPRSSLRPTLVAAGDGPTGSERPTQINASNGKTLKETHTQDHRQGKIFVAESSKVFWGKGLTISAEGRSLLNTIAAYMAEVPGQIVVCETGRDDQTDLGIERAFSVVRHLQSKGIKKNRCNISIKPMTEIKTQSQDRRLEITIIDELSSG